MTFEQYQANALTTSTYPKSRSIRYPALGLCGEAGEVANQVKKIDRDDGGFLTHARMVVIAQELGDVLWYVAAICSDIGVSMERVANDNLLKLEDRAKRGTISGSGDMR